MSPKLRFLLVAAAPIAFVAGGWVGFMMGLDSAGKGAKIEELKTHHANLLKRDLNPQLREYLKSRIYTLAAELEARDIAGIPVDFGPVDESILAGTTGNKGGDSQAEVYQRALTKHGTGTAKP